MKIGINASFTRKPNTGIGQVTVNYLKALNENPQNFEYVLYLEEDVNFELKRNFKKNIFLPRYKRDDLIRKIWWEKFSLPHKVKEDNCDAFISLYQCPTVLPKNISHTMVVHDIIPKIFPEYLNNLRKKLYWKLTEKAIEKINKIITVSERSRKDLEKYLCVPLKKISVKYIDVDNIYKKEVSEKKSKRILEKYNLEKGYIYSGGGLEKRKNINTLIHAYKLLLGKNEDVPPLVISGKLMPELAPLVIDAEKIAKDLGIENRVKFLGFVPQEDLPAIYKNATLFVYPSLYEGFGLPALEAMNQGVPVLLSSISSLPEVGGEAVEYCDPKDKEQIAKKIENILNNEGLRNDLSRKGKEQAKKFSWKDFIK